MTTIQIKYGYLKAASRIMARNDIRFFLNGVQVQAIEKETILVATNGHILLVMRSDAENDVSEPTDLIIPASIVDEIIDKNHKIKRQKIELRGAEDGRYKAKLPVHGGNASLEFSSVEGKYPDWRRVVPKSVSMEPCRYSPFYLSAFEKAARDTGAYKKQINTVVLQNGKDAGVVLLQGNKDFLGLAMPIKTDKQKIPGWVLAAATQETEEAQ